MSGTKAGGKKAAKTNKDRHGKDFYKTIGAMSSKNWNKETGKPKGFMVGDNARIFGARGGTISRRRKAGA